MFSLLRRNPRYARLWSGESVSILGDQITALALPMVGILTLDATPWEIGLLTAASWAPYPAALLIGSVVDRFPTKRPALIAADLVRAAALVSIPLAFVLDHLTLAQLITVAMVVGLAAVVSQTAYIGFFVRVVGTDDVIRANSLISASRSAAGLAGPPAAGWLIQALSAPIAIVVDCASYLVSAATLFGLRVEVRQPQPPRRHILREAAEGLLTLVRDRWLSSILWCTTLMNFANYAIMALLLVFATGALRLAPAAIGTAQGIGALGALVGALIAARLADRVGLFPVTMIGSLLFSLPFLGVALTPGGAPATVKIVWFGACAMLISGGIMLYDININAVLIKVMPENMRGRLVGAFSSINYGIRPLGALAGGAAGQFVGPRTTIIAAVAVGLLAIIPLLGSPLRRCRTLADVATEVDTTQPSAT